MTDAIYWHPLGTKGPWNLRDDDKRISVGIAELTISAPSSPGSMGVRHDP